MHGEALLHHAYPFQNLRNRTYVWQNPFQILQIGTRGVWGFGLLRLWNESLTGECLAGCYIDWRMYA